MHASDHGMDLRSAGELVNIAERVDDARVRAAQQHHHSLASHEVEGLVINYGIRLCTRLIQKEGSADILEGRHTRDRARDVQAR